jgi:hypothetical protein
MTAPDACLANTKLDPNSPMGLQDCGEADCDGSGGPDECIKATIDYFAQQFRFCACVDDPPPPDPDWPCIAILRNDGGTGWGPACVGECVDVSQDCKRTEPPPKGYIAHCSCQQ